jgi:tetratricopeptide (TPR) repeat protein
VGLGNAYREGGSGQEAITAYQTATQLDPQNATAYANLGDVYNANGYTEEALTAYKQAVDLNPKDSLSRGSLAGVYRRLGNNQEYEKHMRVARELIADESEYNQACLEAIAGNIERALNLLKIALDKHQVQLEWVRRDPDLDAIRDDPRFKELVGSS